MMDWEVKSETKDDWEVVSESADDWEVVSESPLGPRRGTLRSGAAPYVAVDESDPRRYGARSVSTAGGGRGNMTPEQVAELQALANPGAREAVAKQNTQRAKTRATANSERTWGEAGSDALVALAKGGNSLMTLPVAAFAPSTKAYDWLKENRKTLDEMESPQMRARREVMAERLQADPDEMARFWTSLKDMLSDPGIAASTIIEQLPLAGAIVATGGAGAAVGRLAAGAAVGRLAAGARGARIGANTGMATGGAVLAGGDAAQSVYDRIMDPQQTPDEVLETNPDYNTAIVRGSTPAEARQAIAESRARLAAALAAPLGALSGVVGLKAPGAERVATGSGGVAARAARGARAGVADVAAEVPEELGTQAASNFAISTVDPSQALTEGFGQTAASAIVGGHGSGAAAAVQGYRAPVMPPLPQDMPADRILSPEEIQAVKDRADLERAMTAAAEAQAAGMPPAADQGVQQTEGAGGSRPTPAAPNAPASTQAAEPTRPAAPAVGVAAVPQGSLADAAQARMQADGQDRQRGAAQPAALQTGEGRAPDAGGGVGASGRAAAAPQRPVAGAPDANRVEGQPRVDAGASDAQSVVQRVRSIIESRRERWFRAADNFEAVGAGEQAQDVRRRALRLPMVNDPTDGPALRQFNTLADAMERVFGRRVYAYSDQSQAAQDGFYDREIDATFVNIDLPEMNVAKTIMHEFRHQMRVEAERGVEPAQRAEKLLDSIWDMISPEGKRAYAEKYLFKAQLKDNRTLTVDDVLADPKRMDLLKEEMQADFMAKRATDRRFMRKLAKREPETFGDFVRQWIDTLSSLIEELRGTGGAAQKNVDRYIARLEEAKGVAEEVMVEWARANPQQAKSAGVDVSAWEGEGGRVLESARAGEPPRRRGKPGPPPGWNPDDDDELGSFNPFRSETGDPKEDEWIPEPDVIETGKTPEELGLDSSGYPDFPVVDERKLDRIRREELAEEQDIPVGEVIKRPMSPEEVASLVADTEREARRVDGAQVQEGPTPRGPVLPIEVDLSSTPNRAIKAAGLMAESAYPDLPWTRNFDNTGDWVKVRVGDKSWTLIRRDDPRSRTGAPSEIVGRVTNRNLSGELLDNISLSKEGGKQWLKRFFASADLFRRRFDLWTSIPPDARGRVVDLWKSIAKMPGAFRFEKDVAPSGRTSAEIVQKIADQLLDGSEWRADARASTYTNSNEGFIERDAVIVDMFKNGEPQGYAYIEIVDRRRQNLPPKLRMHTQNFVERSGAGTPFYQVAFRFADARGWEVEADPVGLLSVNTYRRTEQQLSAALRSGRTKNVQPGYGQRIYGWNDRPKDAEQEDRNMARMALAAARNAAEFFPGIKSIRYDIKNDKFVYPDGSSAELTVELAMQDPDTKALSFGRSTLARAALTFEAIEGTVDLSGIDEIRSPILYSSRAGEQDQATPARPSRNSLRGGRIRMTITEMVDAAIAMDDWRDWYERHEATLREMFGEDAELFQKMLAATSQAATVPSNVALALKAYRQYYAGEEFTGFLPAVIKNLQRIRAEEAVRGAKISEYDRATAGDPDGTAVDRHIAQLMFNTSRPNRRQIAAAHRRIGELAEILGWERRQVQSTLWAYNQVRKGKNPDEIETYDTLLKRRLADVAEVRRLAEDARARSGGVRGPSRVARERDGLQRLRGRARTRDAEGEQYGTIQAEGIDLTADGPVYSERYAGSSATEVDPYSRWGDRKVQYQVRVTDTGEVATLTVPAAQAARALDSRATVFRSLISCLMR